MPAGKRKNTRRMTKLREEFFVEGKRLDADPATRDEALCWLCRGRIDYVAQAGSTPDSHNLDHYHAVDDRPDLEEDPDNFRHSHAGCNLARGKRTPSPGLGAQVPAWW